ncbi:MAG TPA: DUF4304 domain-containing protein [Planctomycetaceae bacterium]|jgi:hypothetical protein
MTSPSSPKPYQWDFDRVLPNEDVDFLTFSVGVFQWLPKASGRGLKKSTSIRVKGYAAEYKLVHDKAQELCKRLNRDQVRSDDPPAWVQKQYSVPRPADLIVERIDDSLTGAQVRAVRLREMRRLLLPAGFVRAPDGAYVRQIGNQIHLIGFQGAKYGGEYTVNLGFHYSFAPGFFQKKRLRPSQFHLLDCAFRTRIGSFIPGGLDRWFPYGDDRERLRATFNENVELCLSTFERFSRKWEDPAQWLAKIPLTGRCRSRTTAPWGLDYPLLLAACVAKEVGRSALSAKYREQFIASAIRCVRPELWQVVFQRLAASV